MSDGSSQEASVSPPRPPKRRGLAIWLSLVTSATMAVVLLANDGRNLKLLMKRLGVDYSARTAYPPKDDVSQPRPASVKSWPFNLPPGPALEPVISFQPADQRCLSLAMAGQEPPEFSTENGGTWQCVMFWAKSEEPDAPSVFLQIRGTAQGEITAWRAKFSKGNAPGTEIASQGLQVLRQALQILGLADELFSTLETKINDWHEFYYYIGDQRLSFKAEFSDPSRFNLLAQRRRLPTFIPPPIATIRPSTAHGGKGPRTFVSQSEPSGSRH